MAYSQGDVVWLASTFVEFDGRTRAYAAPAEVVGVFDGILMVRRRGCGGIRAVDNISETVCDSEADAWAAAARELAEARDRVQAAIDEATAKAAGSRVGEAIAS